MPRRAGPRSRRRLRSKAAATPPSRRARQSRRAAAAAAAARPSPPARQSAVRLCSSAVKRRVEIGFGVDVGQHVTGQTSQRIPNVIDCAAVSRSVSPMYSRILRFAPSPNGYLHLGHAYSALLNHDMARELGGRLLLRIEDIDASAAGRNTRRRSTRICAGSASHGSEPVRRQSEHFDDYAAALAKLEAQGLLYPSFESRSEIDRAGRRARPAGRLAARSRRRADLSGPGAQAVRRRTRSAAAPRANRLRCGSPWTARWRAPAC